MLVPRRLLRVQAHQSSVGDAFDFACSGSRARLMIIASRMQRRAALFPASDVGRDSVLSAWRVGPSAPEDGCLSVCSLSFPSTESRKGSNQTQDRDEVSNGITQPSS